MTSRPRAALLALLLACVPLAHAELGPAGGEFQVNSYTLRFQGLSNVATDADGNFVVVWQSGNYGGGQDGSGAGIFAQRFDALGARRGTEFIVNSYTLGNQGGPAIASDPTGGFVVAWTGGSGYYYGGVQQDGSASGVFVQRFDGNGAPAGSEFRANATTRGRQAGPAIARDAAGNFVIVWQSGGYRFTQDGSATGIFGQRFDAFGTPLGPEFQVNTYTFGSQVAPAVASDPLGNFVVVWQSGYYGTGQDGSYGGIFGQRYDSAGMPVGGEFQVNTYTTGSQGRPSVATDALGDFVVAWDTGDYGGSEDGDGNGVFGQRFDSAGIPIGGEFQVNTFTTGDQFLPRVAADADGNFVVAWQSSSYYGIDQDGSGSGIFAQHFSASGIPLGPEFQVNTYTQSSQVRPRIAAAPGGDFVVAWDGAYFQDGSGIGVFGQRFHTTAFSAPALVAGNRLVLRDGADPRSKSLSARCDDAAIGLGGGLGTIDDPTAGGGHLRVRGPTFDDTYELPASNWRARGTPTTGYEYRDAALLAGPVKSIKVRRGRFKVTAKGAQLGHSLAMDPSPVALVLQIGDRGARFCAVYGGTIEYKPDVVYRGRRAPAPSECPR